MKIIKNKILAPLTTFKIGGPAQYFCVVKNEEEICKAFLWAKNNKLPYFILAGGSNVLISDKGIKGLVIKIQKSNLKMQNEKEKFKILAKAGVPLGELIQFSFKNGLSGLECLAGIPGTIGGAVWGNCGTVKGSISDVIEKVKVLNEGKIIDLKARECQFGYRTSRFKKSKEIILEIVLKLKKEKTDVINANIQKALGLRRKQPKGKSAGSIFKNPVGLFAGYLIEQVGLKGKIIGQAQISPEHANWIINLNKAKAQDVLKLIKLAKIEVEKKFKIKLEEEINIVGIQQISNY